MMPQPEYERRRTVLTLVAAAFIGIGALVGAIYGSFPKARPFVLIALSLGLVLIISLAVVQANLPHQ
jgi:hypothetical protein